MTEERVFKQPNPDLLAIVTRKEGLRHYETTPAATQRRACFQEEDVALRLTSGIDSSLREMPLLTRIKTGSVRWIPHHGVEARPLA